MRQTSGIIINGDIFINSSHVAKIDKTKVSDGEYEIKIYLDVNESPIKFTFNNDNDCDNIFNKIIMEMYGLNYAIVNFKN